MENKKKNRIIKYTFLLGLFLVVLGTSYALFSITLIGKKKTRITTANFGLTLTDINGNEETDGIAVNLENVVPEADEEGLKRDGYKFVVTNTGNIPASYELKLNSTGTLSEEYIKYALIEKDYLKKSDGTYYNGGIYSNELQVDVNNQTLQAAPLLSTISNNKLDGTTLLPGEKIEYELKIWLDYNADNNASGKEYQANILIDGYQSEVRMTGKIGENSKYTLYNDGTLVVSGTGEVKSGDANGYTSYYNGGAAIDILRQYLNSKGYDFKPFDSITLSNDSTDQNVKNVGALLSAYSWIYNNYTDFDLLYNKYPNFDIVYRPFKDIAKTEEEEKNFYILLKDAPKIKRLVVDEGITSIEYAILADFGNPYMETLPSTLQKIGRFSVSTNFGYGLILPPKVSNIGEGFGLGTNLRYLDLGSVKHISTEAIDIRFMKEITIPNTVESVETFGISVENHDMIINIDNTREYVEANWDSNWLNKDSNSNVTINYLR